MTQAAAARYYQPSSSQTSQTSQQQPHENGAQQPTNAQSPNLVPPPSAPPALVHAINDMKDTRDPLVTLREKPVAIPKETFDSPYARSANSTAPGSPRMYVTSLCFNLLATLRSASAHYAGLGFEFASR